MTNDQIEKFLSMHLDTSNVQISFKTRKPITGIFIKTKDYAELKSKNFWRVIGEAFIEQYRQSQDINLGRIYNGSEFTKLGLQR